MDSYLRGDKSSHAVKPGDGTVAGQYAHSALHIFPSKVTLEMCGIEHDLSINNRWREGKIRAAKVASIKRPQFQVSRLHLCVLRGALHAIIAFQRG